MKPSERIFEIAKNFNHGTDAICISGEMLIWAILDYLDEEKDNEREIALAYQKRSAPKI